MKRLTQFIISNKEPEDKNIGWIRIFEDGTYDLLLYENGWNSLLTHTPDIDGKINAIVGNLALLNTTANDTIVNAINEVDNESVKSVKVNDTIYLPKDGMITLDNISPSGGGDIINLGIINTDFYINDITTPGIYKYASSGDSSVNYTMIVSDEYISSMDNSYVSQTIFGPKGITYRKSYNWDYEPDKQILTSGNTTEINLTSNVQSTENIDDSYVLTAKASIDKFNYLTNSIDALNQEFTLRFPFKVLSFSGGGYFKKGTLANGTISWAYDGIPSSQQLLVDDVSANIALSDRSYKYSNISEDTRFTLLPNNNYSLMRTVMVEFINPRYIGIVKTIPTTEAQIKGLKELLPVVYSKSYTWSGDLNQEMICYAYPKIFGSLSTIKDANGFDYIEGYTRSEIVVNNESYFVYVSSKSTIDGFKQIFN